MKATARLSYLRMAPRKIRLVADVLRGKRANEAQVLLRFIGRRAAEPMLKLLHSAIASAKKNFQLEESNLYISKITVDEGPKLKRFRPRARGRAYPIQKKTSHITLILDEIGAGSMERARPKEGRTPEVQEAQQKKERVFARAKPRFRVEKETARQTREPGIKRIFRRKTV